MSSLKLTEKIAVASVVSVLFKVLMAGVVFRLGGYTMEFGTIDGVTIAAILTPCLANQHLETYVKGKNKNDNVSSS